MVDKRPDLTFRYNLGQKRHSWLRLTPAYSVKLVEEILDDNLSASHILDPFSGTGTTGLVCASRGIRCTLFDINPFLIWLAKVKTAHYETSVLEHTQFIAHQLVQDAKKMETKDVWIPSISHIHRWWTPHRLHVLGKLFHQIQIQLKTPEVSSQKDLLLIAFCRILMQWSNAAFNHQSISFKSQDTAQMLFAFDEEDEIYQSFLSILHQLIKDAAQPIKSNIHVKQADARNLKSLLDEPIDCVITSPPYPNRMSYIRELRPYMFWLSYLENGRDAGDLDWQAIGGTWGIATSRLNTWQAPSDFHLPMLEPIICEIQTRSLLLANYVHKYFVDIFIHLKHLYDILKPGARLYYVVGNSRFYDTLVPVEQLYIALITQLGYDRASARIIRKRNSKKELFEFLVSAEKPT